MTIAKSASHAPSVGQRLAALRLQTTATTTPTVTPTHRVIQPLFGHDSNWEDEGFGATDGPSFDDFVAPTSRAQRRKVDYFLKANAAFDSWWATLDLIEEPYLDACGQATQPNWRTSSCDCSCEQASRRSVRCICITGVETLSVVACSDHLVANLVRIGLFPANTCIIHTAFSFDLLRLFRSLKRHSRLGAQGFVKALFDFHNDDQGFACVDDTRKQLKRAALWFEVVEQRVQAKLLSPPSMSDTGDLINPTTAPPRAVTDPDLHLTLADLSTRCPACFGGIAAGVDSSQSPDVIVCLDGNFTHKRRRRNDAVTRNPATPTFFLSARQVDIAEKAFKASARSDGPRTGCSSEVRAAVEGAVKASKGAFDVVGVIGMTCRHGSPLLLCDVRETGEAHFYAFALLDHLLEACGGRLKSIGICYDIGCKLSASPRLRASLRRHKVDLRFAVSLFHVYGHDLDCQLKFSPRRTLGYGLTDGESLERLWSAMSDLISVTRGLSRVGRHIALSVHLAFLASENMARLASFLKTRLNRIEVERLKVVPQLEDGAASVIANITMTAPLTITAPTGLPVRLIHLAPAFESLARQRQNSAFSRPAYRRKKNQPADPLHLSAHALYVALSQWHALDSFSKRRDATASQKSQERLTAAKTAAYNKAKRLRPLVNDVIKARTLPNTLPTTDSHLNASASPVPSVDVSDLRVIEEAGILSPDTLTRVARYGAHHSHVKEPWFLDSLLMAGLDGYEMLVRCDEEAARVESELGNLEAHLRTKRAIIQGNSAAVDCPGWAGLVERELARLGTIRTWWARPPPKKAAHSKVLDAVDNLASDDNSDDEDEAAGKGSVAPHLSPPSDAQEHRYPPQLSTREYGESDKRGDGDEPSNKDGDEFELNDDEYDARYGLASVDQEIQRLANSSGATGCSDDDSSDDDAVMRE
ncbi:hypothetical protein CF326_g1548 [Tilletia indica]|nr:hypothetical protein CF326_g1548 [Tilletia indica]